MADKELIIRLDEETYDAVCEGQCFGKLYLNTLRKICDAIKSSTPLPKGHGRLIDVDELIRQYKLDEATKYGNKNAKQQAYSYSTMMLYEIADMIDDAPTIIEADKGDEE